MNQSLLRVESSSVVELEQVSAQVYMQVKINKLSLSVSLRIGPG